MRLNQEQIRRMVGQGGGSVRGGGSFDPSLLSGYATMIWTEENYLSKVFFNNLFTIHTTITTVVTDDHGDIIEGPTVTTGILTPNEEPGETITEDGETGYTTTVTVAIESVEVKAGLWTDKYLSALGKNSGGGGGGATLLSELDDVELTNLTNGQGLIYNATSGKWENQNIGGGGGGGGTLTSIGLVMPTGFAVSPSTLTADGSFTVSFAEGYSLPTSAKQTNWDSAYTFTSNSGFGTAGSDYVPVRLGSTTKNVLTAHQSLEGYASELWVGQQISGMATQTWADGRFVPLAGTTQMAGTFRPASNGGASLGTSSYRFSNVYAQNANLSTKLTIGGIEITVENGALKIDGDVFATGAMSALGQSSGGGGGAQVLDDLLDVNISNPTAGQVLKYHIVNGVGGWYNGTDQGVTSLAWSQITGKPTTISGYGITDAKIQGGVITLGANSITPITSLAGYATESWADGRFVPLAGTTQMAGTFRPASNGGAALGTSSYRFSNVYAQNANLSTKLTIGGIEITVENGALKIDGDVFATGAVSALGQSSGGSGGSTALSDLVDVELSNPTNGQVLKYNSTTRKWYNGDDEGVTTLAWSQITNKPTTISGYGITDAKIQNGVITLGSNTITPITSLAGYATETWVSGQGYLTASSLTGYATETWVSGQGYLTASSLTGYATEAWVRGAFEAIDRGTSIQENGSSSSHYNLNLLTKPGVFTITNNANAAYFDNRPVNTNTAFRIVVYQTRYNTRFLAQRFSYSGSPDVYERYSGDAGATWGSWYQVEGDLSIYASASSVTTLEGYFDSSGAANKAVILKTSRTLWGQSFDGSANVTGTIQVGAGDVEMNNNTKIAFKDSGGTLRESFSLYSNNKLHIGYGSAGAGYDTYLNGNNIYFSYGTGHTNGMILTSGGNVGIGTTSPSVKLDVSGTINCTSIVIGGITLTADNNGIHVNSAGLYADTYASALGLSDGSGGSTALSDLVDVEISSPTNGQVLKYNSSTHKWYNGTDEGVTTLAWSQITNKPTTISGYGITDAKIQNGVITLGSNTITPITSLAGYATETWVSGQGYLTASSLTGYATEAWVRGAFEAIDGATNIQSRGTSSSHYNLNLLTEIGTYAITNNSNASYFDNRPITSSTAFRVVVYKTRDSDNYIAQRFCYSGSTDAYERYSTNGGTSWGSWYKVTGDLSEFASASYFTNGVANTAAKLSTVSKTAWGRTYWTSGGVPDSISGDMSSVGNISFSATGKHIGSLLYFDTEKPQLKVGTNSTTAFTHAGVSNYPKLYVDGEIGTSGGMWGGFAELYYSTPYIDFHYNNSTSDYTSRIIESASGSLTFKSTASSPKYYLGTDSGKTTGLHVGYNNNSYIQIGSIKLVYESSSNSLRVESSSGSAANLYALGGISALGIATNSDAAISSDLIPSINGNFTIGSGTKGWTDLFLCDGGSSKLNIYADSGGAWYSSSGSHNFEDAISVEGTGYFSGKVSIAGTNSNSDKLYVKGSMRSSGISYASSHNNTSDARLKNIISNENIDIQTIANAPLVKFSWKDGDGRVNWGTLAQYWLGTEMHDMVVCNDFLTMDYSVTALASVISVARKVMTHEERIKALEAENEILKQEIAALKAA